MLAAALLFIGCLYAAWDFNRVGQIYRQAASRDAAYRDNPLHHAKQSWLFKNQADFAELTTQTVTTDNAAELYPQALRLMHYSPEARVVQRVIDSGGRVLTEAITAPIADQQDAALRAMRALSVTSVRLRLVDKATPNGQLPAYEWNFGDVNPPVHAWACLRVFEMSGGSGHPEGLGFLGATMRPGVDLVADTIGLDAAVAEADDHAAVPEGVGGVGHVRRSWPCLHGPAGSRAVRRSRRLRGRWSRPPTVADPPIRRGDRTRRHTPKSIPTSVSRSRRRSAARGVGTGRSPRTGDGGGNPARGASGR